MVRHFVRQPLPTSFMLASMIGMIFSAVVIWDIDVTWGFTFTAIFLVWFIASVVNFTHADEGEHLDVHDSEELKRLSKLYDLE